MKPLLLRNRRQAGGSLVEVLVTLVILLLGLLGLVGLMLQAQRSQMESYQREQALVILQDMVSRMTANPAQVAACYKITTAADGTPYVGTGYTGTPACGVSPFTNAQIRAATDLQEWDALLKGSAEVAADTSKVGAMVGARGCISADATLTGVYWVSVSWQGNGKTVAPAVACGKDLYGDDTQRRTVSVPVKIVS